MASALEEKTASKIKSTSEEKTTAKRYQEYDEKVRIALLGEKGYGKSDFLAGLETFISQDTNIGKCGTFKLNEKIRFFKLPGLPTSVGDYGQCDLILFFTTSSKLEESELSVLKIIGSVDKKVFVVLSRMEEAAKIGDDEAVYTDEKTKFCNSTLKSVPGFKKEDIFLVNNEYPIWDFELLITSILDALPLCIVRRLTPLAAPVFDCDDVDKYANRKPLHGLCNFFDKNIPAWSKAEVNIAVIGNAGTGKSSYINAIRGLDDDAEEAAKVGHFCGDTTKAPKHFTYQDNPNIRLWDIQGFGSTESGNNVENFAKKIDLKKYDCFLIFFDTRLSANDVQLAQKLQELKKPFSFFFVLTKADTIKNKKGSVEISGSEKPTMLEKARESLTKMLKDLGFGNQQLFLISSLYRNDYDFKKLTQAILDALPESKRRTLTLSLQACYRSVLKKKFEILRGKVKWAATKAGVYCAVPVPDAVLGYMFDVVVVKEQVEEYRSQLGLDKEGKKYLDEYIARTKATVESNETGATWSGYYSGLAYSAKAVTKVSGVATFAVVAASASYEGWSAQRTLHQCLDNLEKEAEEYLEKIVEKATSKVVKNQ